MPKNRKKKPRFTVIDQDRFLRGLSRFNRPEKLAALKSLATFMRGQNVADFEDPQVRSEYLDGLAQAAEILDTRKGGAPSAPQYVDSKEQLLSLVKEAIADLNRMNNQDLRNRRKIRNPITRAGVGERVLFKVGREVEAGHGVQLMRIAKHYGIDTWDDLKREALNSPP